MKKRPVATREAKKPGSKPAFFLPLFLSITVMTWGCAGPSQVEERSLALDGLLQGEKAATVSEAPLEEPPSGKKAASNDRFRELPSLSEAAPARKAESGPALVSPFSDQKSVQVAFDTMPLADFVHHLFGDVLKVNYVVDDNVSKNQTPVSLNLKEPVSERKLFDLAKDILGQQNVDVLTKNGIFYVWQKSKEKKAAAVGVGASLNDIPQSPGDVFQIAPVRYGDAANIATLLSQITGAQMTPQPQDNIVTIKGPRAEVEAALQMLAVLDRPALRGRFVTLVNLEYWTPKDLIPKLKEILTQEGVPFADTAGRSGIYLTPVERLNAVLVFAAEKAWFERVKEWVQVLDVPAVGKEERYFIYTPKNAKATELGYSLDSILGVGSERAGTREGQKKAVSAPSGTLARRDIITPTEPPATERAAASAPAAEKETPGTGTRTGGDISTFPEVRFTVDENHNALVFYTTPEEYKKIKDFLEQLDTPPLQVTLKATVAEVTLTDKLQYGLEWYIKHTSDGTSHTILTKDLLGLGAGAISYAGIMDSGNIEVIFTALAKDDLIKILSSPSLTVRDGKSASIVVGTEVPVVTSQATSDVTEGGTSSILQSIQYRSTGVQLQVTPTVNAEGIITLEITQEVSEAQTNKTSNIDSPLILNRTITTEVVTGDGQTVILGGLIKENDSSTETRVPILGSLPLLGYLFKNTDKSKDRTELVVMITPQIVRCPAQIESIKKDILRGFEYLKPETPEKNSAPSPG